MKKIPTLFERKFENHEVVDCLPNVTPGMEWVLEGKGTATLKLDGSCCAIINGELYKRYDAKKGKQPPEGAIPCQPEPDPITSHWPHWVKCDPDNPADKWFWEAYRNSEQTLSDGTYEAIGPHFQNNPYGLVEDSLIRHGSKMIFGLERTYERIKEYLQTHNLEGIVFWKDGEPKCKIKRSDFGFSWPVPEEEKANLFPIYIDITVWRK